MKNCLSYDKVMGSVLKIKERLQDEESHKIYDIRLRYLLERSDSELISSHIDLSDEWYIDELEKCIKSNVDVNEIVLFGAGGIGKRTKKLLERSVYKQYPILFCDNNPRLWGENEGVRIISPENLIAEHKNAVVIIASRQYLGSLYEQLCMMGFQRNRILYPKQRVLYGCKGWQYFDVFEPNADEVFVDCGCYDAMSSIDFVKWCKGKYRKIYAFEAGDEGYSICSKNIKKHGIENIELFHQAVWDKCEKMYVEVAQWRAAGVARLFYEGNNCELASIDGVSLDSVIKERVTFIKMDIEGSEFEALLGAKEMIKRDKPKLAIAVYHKPKDIVVLPYLIQKMNPDYKFLLRQYTSDVWETVLYAF